MRPLLNFFRTPASTDETSLSTSRNLIATIGALYLTWHFIATLGWPKVFNPSLWASTLIMLIAFSLALWLLEKYYPLAHIVWLFGLAAVIINIYFQYHHPETMLFLVTLPLMAVVTLGYTGTAIVEATIFTLMLVLPRLGAFPPLPDGYATGIILASIFMAFFGWSISSNLSSALESASYHYKQARELLDETRQHRAEISRMLKDRTQVNYQLERLNLMLQEARAHAEEARAERDRFVLAISHELRSPLNFIIGFSDLMVKSPETYDSLEHWPTGLYDDVQEIYRSSTHLLGLINDILDMGQIDAQQMAIFREEVHLDQITEEVQEMVGRAFAQKGLYLRVRLADNLPPVFVDHTRIRQVLLNLVNNSLRFTEQGGVTIGIERKDDTVQVCVADTGAGIAADDIPKVFSEFRQGGVDPWHRREGSGLGLSISRRFIEMHGGRIWLESILGEGTQIYFTIPVLQSEDTLESLQTTSFDSPPSEMAEAPRKLEKLVLLYTTNEIASRVARQWLKEYQVVTVKNPRHLAEQVRHHLPQAILVDKQLDRALEVSARDLPYPVPLFSFYFPSALSQGPQLPPGVASYLVKPVTRQVLYDAVTGLGPDTRNLLVVEDDPVMVRFIVQTLKASSKGHPGHARYRILSASTGAEALRLMKDESIDAVLLDLMLPDMVGWEILATLHQGEGKDRPQVIVISAGDLPQVLFTQGQRVFDVTLNRPLSQAELPELLHCLVETIRPIYPKPADLDASTPPANPSA
jgi:signal transduction histidine kinase/CheY-like chemotaxis protein